jgi:hypothetical protein
MLALLHFATVAFETYNPRRRKWIAKREFTLFLLSGKLAILLLLIFHPTLQRRCFWATNFGLGNLACPELCFRGQRMQLAITICTLANHVFFEWRERVTGFSYNLNLSILEINQHQLLLSVEIEYSLCTKVQPQDCM